MKASICTLCASALLLGAVPVDSQAPATFDPVQKLQALKLKNEAILEKQAEVLERLEAMRKTASQIRILARRG